MTRCGDNIVKFKNYLIIGIILLAMGGVYFSSNFKTSENFIKEISVEDPITYVAWKIVALSQPNGKERIRFMH